MEKGMYQANQHHGDISHKRLYLNKPQEGWMQPHKQVALKVDKHKPTEGIKQGKNLDLAKQNMDVKHRGKQAYTCIRKRSKPFDIGLDRKI